MHVVNVVLLGLGTGAIYALLGDGIVLVFRASRVLNFASAAIGMFGAYIVYDLWKASWPLAAAIFVGFGASAAIGVLTHLLVMRRLVRASGTARIVATLGLMTALIGLTGQIFASQDQAQAVPTLFPVGFLSPGWGLKIPETQGCLALVAIGATILLISFQRRTRLGLATVAAAENPTVLSSSGTSPNVVAAAAWGAGGVLAAAAVMLLAPLSALSPTDIPPLIVPALVAGMIGGFDSFGLTLAGGMIMGISVSLVTQYVTQPGWADAGPLVILIGVLILRGRTLPSKAYRGEKLGTVGSGRFGIGAIVAVIVGIGVILLVADNWVVPVTATLLSAFIVLSIVVLTGYAGQLSLMQLSLAGVGALFTAYFNVDLHIALILAIILAVIVTVPIGLVITLPVLRTRGNELAIATLALAVVGNDLIFGNPSLTGNLGQSSLGKLSLFGWVLDPLSNPRGFGILVILVFALVAFAVGNIRRGNVGRMLLAVRSNERAAASLGISVPKAKFAAVAIASCVAAIGGALLESQFAFAQMSGFDPISSINSVLYSVIGGIGWISGSPFGGAAAPGGLAPQILGLWVSPSDWLEIITGLGVMFIMIQAPDGIMSLHVRQARWLARHSRRVLTRSPNEVRERLAGEDGKQVATARSSAPRQVSLAVRGITVRFGSVEAVKNFDLELGPGEIVGLIGPNGAGKSTVVEAICGFEPVAAGSVAINGRDVSNLSPSARSRLGVARTFQSIELFDDMSVLDNLRAAVPEASIWQSLRDVVHPKPGVLTGSAARAIGAFGLDNCLTELPASLDYWLRRTVGVARALATSPGLLILDEPAAGSDARRRSELKDLLRRVAVELGVGLLVIEHDVEFVFDLCHRVVAIDNGRVIADGPPSEMRTNDALIAAYLGQPDGEAVVSHSVDTGLAAEGA